MNLVHYSPHRRANLRSNGASRLFDSFFDDFFQPALHGKPQSLTGTNQQLRVDIYEKDGAVFIDAELPGVEKENISVDVKGKSITLRAERARDNEVGEEQNYRSERQYGKLTRSFSLPFELGEEKIHATYKNGLLRLKIEKPTEQTVQKIDIN